MAAVAAMDSNPSQRSKGLKAIGEVVKFMVQFILSFPCPGEGRDPGWTTHWIAAFAAMTIHH